MPTAPIGLGDILTASAGDITRTTRIVALRNVPHTCVGTVGSIAITIMLVDTTPRAATGMMNNPSANAVVTIAHVGVSQQLFCALRPLLI